MLMSPKKKSWETLGFEENKIKEGIKEVRQTRLHLFILLYHKILTKLKNGIIFVEENQLLCIQLIIAILYRNVESQRIYVSLT